MKCFGCQREIEVGDHYIADTASGFIGQEANPDVDAVIADIFGGASGSKVVFCTDCTTEGGDYLAETYYGDDLE